MSSLPVKVIAIGKRGDQYQVIVQISTKYRGSFNTLAFYLVLAAVVGRGIELSKRQKQLSFQFQREFPKAFREARPAPAAVRWTRRD